MATTQNTTFQAPKNTQTSTPSSSTGAQATTPQTPKSAPAPKKTLEATNWQNQYKDLNAEQLDKELSVSGLSDDQKKTLIELKENQAKGKTTEDNDDEGIINNPKADREQKEFDDKGPFKEGDIIQYMYSDWIIGGANWLWCETGKKIYDSYYWLKDHHPSMPKWEKKNANNNSGSSGDTSSNSNSTDSRESSSDNSSEYITQRVFEQSINLTEDKLKSSGETLSAHTQQRNQDYAFAATGEWDKTSFDKNTIAILKGLEKDTVSKGKSPKEMYSTLSQKSATLDNNIDLITSSSALIAHAQIMHEQSQNPQAFEGKDLTKVAELYTKRNSVLIGLACDKAQAKGENSDQLLNSLNRQSKDAFLQANDNYVQGRFRENGQEAGPTPALDKIDNVLTQSAKQHDIAKPMGMLESLHSDDERDEAIQTKLGNADKQKETLDTRKENNTQRQNNLLDSYEKMLEKAEKSGNLQLQKIYLNKIQTLSKLGTQSGVVANDQRAKSTINANRRNQMNTHNKVFPNILNSRKQNG